MDFRMAKTGLKKVDKEEVIRWKNNEGKPLPTIEEKSGYHGNLNALKHGIFASRITVPDSHANAVQLGIH